MDLVKRFRVKPGKKVKLSDFDLQLLAPAAVAARIFPSLRPCKPKPPYPQRGVPSSARKTASRGTSADDLHPKGIIPHPSSYVPLFVIRGPAGRRARRAP